MIAPAVPPAELGLGAEPRTRVSVFMNVFDCHVNRAPRRRPGGARRLPSGQVPERLARQGQRGQRAERPRHRDRRRAEPRGGADRRAGRAAHRLLRRRGREPPDRRALRADPLRLAARRLPARRGRAALLRRPGGGRRRDGDRRPRLGRAAAPRGGCADERGPARAAAVPAAGAEPRHHPRALRRADGAALRLRRAVRAGGGADHLRGAARRLRRADRPQARRGEPVRGRARTRSPTSSTSGWRRRSSSTSSRSAAPRTSAGPRRWSSRSAPASARPLQPQPRRPGDRPGALRRGAGAGRGALGDAAGVRRLRRHRRRRGAAVARGALAGGGGAADDLPPPDLRPQGHARSRAGRRAGCWSGWRSWSGSPSRASGS